MKRGWMIVAILLGLCGIIACSSSDNDAIDGDSESDRPTVDGDGDIDPNDGDRDDDGASETDGDESESDGDREPDVEDWVFNRDDYDPVNGWILLDRNETAMLDTIDTAADFGVNHIQLSHDLIMDIDDAVGDDADTLARIATLNAGIARAHEHGMKAYVWAHEFTGVSIDVCFDPADPVWETRAQQYRVAFSAMPDLDGVILMFGSSDLPPWYAFCSCDWCVDNYGDDPLESPPPAVKVQLVAQAIGEVVVNELGKELFIRTFVHEPNEVAWHSDGLREVEGVSFTGMHKGPVQDWQPYNPHHACTGNVGSHPSVLELDLAGEYYGKSELPWAAPGYYWYRLEHAWKNRGIGAVARVQRGSLHALGTPNEVNLYAVAEWVKNPDLPIESVWDGFLESYYALAPQADGQATLKQVLKDTFPIRRKSHYVLGIWALDKGSDIPNGVALDQFDDRGDMPKWDADWTDVWNALDRPNKETVWQVWQEGCEAVVLAEVSLTASADLDGKLATDLYSDLARRMRHQYYAARAWRAAKLFIWANRAKGDGSDTDLPGWMAWARAELETLITEMAAADLGTITLATPGRIQQFLDNTANLIPDGTAVVVPEGLMLSPVTTTALRSDGADFSVSVNQAATLTVEWGTEIPDYGQTVELGAVPADTPTSFSLSDLPSRSRAVLRVRATAGDETTTGGDYWVFTPAQ